MRAREEGAERDVVGAGLGGDEGAVAAVAAGHADDAVGAEPAARLGIGHVLLADMDAVAIELGGEVGPVVHDEGDAALLHDRLQHRRGARGSPSSSTSFSRSCTQATSPPESAASSSRRERVSGSSAGGVIR